METTNFINSLKCSDLQSFILVLEDYSNNYYTKDLEIEHIGFNNNSGYVYFALENGITICSCFGNNVEYIVSNYINGEESFFDNYKEALNFLKYGEENDEENN